MECLDSFESKLKEFENLIWYVARRYHIAGVLDVEDLFQEGLLILDSMFDKYSCHPDSVDFRKLFKTELWHGLSKALRKHKTQKRDYRIAESFESIIFAEPDSTTRAVGYKEQDLNLECESSESSYLENQEHQEIIDLVSKLFSRLNEDEQTVLDLLINPMDWDEIDPSFQTTMDGLEYYRVPVNPPQHSIAGTLGWSLTYYKQTLLSVRKSVKLVSKEYGFDLFKDAGLGKRRKCRV